LIIRYLAGCRFLVVFLVGTLRSGLLASLAMPACEFFFRDETASGPGDAPSPVLALPLSSLGPFDFAQHAEPVEGPFLLPVPQLRQTRQAEVATLPGFGDGPRP
jgi:hypothetical protein